MNTKFEAILPACSHVPACFGLYMEEASTSPTITGKTTASSSLQFKPTSNSGIALCNVHHLLLPRQNLLSEFFLSPGKIPISCVITSGSTDGEILLLSENHEESK